MAMEKIILKKILTDNPRTYGEPLDFYFSIPLASPTADQYIDNTYQTLYYGMNNILGTAIEDLNPVLGDRFQTFKSDGITMLGFICKYQTTPGASSGNYTLLIYNEEIQAFSIQAGRPYHVTTGKHYLFINYFYMLDSFTTLDEVLERAEFRYNSKTESYTFGMDCSSYNIFQLGYMNVNNNIYLNRFTQDSQLSNNTKLRYYSSWHKLITGKFYKQDELFKTRIDGDIDFYFGKILETTEVNKCVLTAQQADARLTEDTSYGIKDLIYGTDIAYITNSNWTSYVEFKDNPLLRLGYKTYSHLSTRYFQTVLFDASNQNGTYCINEYCYDSYGLGSDNKPKQSRLQYLLTNNKLPNGGLLGKITVAISVDFFISPTYNNISP